MYQKGAFGTVQQSIPKIFCCYLRNTFSINRFSCFWLPLKHPSEHKMCSDTCAFLLQKNCVSVYE